MCVNRRTVFIMGLDMPPRPGRRVIYIKNPKDGGGNFRTILNRLIGGGGGNRNNGTTTPPSAPVRPGVYSNRNGYMPNRTAPGDWAIRNPVYDFTNNYTGQPTSFFGVLPDYGVGPTETSFTIFQPSKTLLGDMYYILRSIEPTSGDIQWPARTPGTLYPGASMSEMSLRAERGMSLHYEGGLPYGGSPPLNPNRNDPMPTWLSIYENMYAGQREGGFTFRDFVNDPRNIGPIWAMVRGEQ